MCSETITQATYNTCMMTVIQYENFRVFFFFFLLCKILFFGKSTNCTFDYANILGCRIGNSKLSSRKIFDYAHGNSTFWRKNSTVSGMDRRRQVLLTNWSRFLASVHGRRQLWVWPFSNEGLANVGDLAFREFNFGNEIHNDGFVTRHSEMKMFHN